MEKFSGSGKKAKTRSNQEEASRICRSDKGDNEDVCTQGCTLKDLRSATMFAVCFAGLFQNFPDLNRKKGY